MTEASLASENFGIVNVDSTLEQRGIECFLKNRLSLGVFDGSHRRSCI